MSDENIVSDNTDDLSSLFDGSVTADVSAATMPTGTLRCFYPHFFGSYHFLADHVVSERSRT
jgi:hypothetical protein